MNRNTIAILFFTLVLVSCAVKPGTPVVEPKPVCIDSLWQDEFNSAEEIVANYNAVKQQIKGSTKEAYTENLCNYIWQCGEYMFRCRGKNEDIALLPQNIEKISFDDATVKSFMIERDTARFADHYFTLKAMERGCSFEESRDGITITVFYPARSMNDNDYAKLREIFSCKNDALHTAYLKKLKFPFRNSGCNEELYSIRPLIEKNVKDSRLKDDIIALFDLYRNIMPGEQAPASTLKSTDGKEYTISDFRGKVLVIDVWATWCSSCLKGFKAFKELHGKYSGNPSVEFITVSVDRKEKFGTVKTVIEKRGISDILNLVTDCEVESQFERDYHISGIPRYIIIDMEEKIVTAYAPPPGGGMEEIIEKTIKGTEK